METTRKRERRIEFVRQRLLRTRLPRLQVMGILTLAGLAGFLTSVILLHLGIHLMALRYSIAIACAYLTFLSCLALWLWLQRRDATFNFDGSYLDFVPTDSQASHSGSFGGAGNFSGGGAGGSWGSGTVHTSTPGCPPPNSSLGEAAFDVPVDFEEGCLLVLAAIAIFGGILASLYVVYIAPTLLAEILVDGALVAGLYRRVKRVEERHWLRAAVRQTIVPAILALLFFTIAGWALQEYKPEAHTIGEVFLRHSRH